MYYYYYLFIFNRKDLLTTSRKPAQYCQVETRNNMVLKTASLLETQQNYASLLGPSKQNSLSMFVQRLCAVFLDVDGFYYDDDNKTTLNAQASDSAKAV